MHRPAMHLTLSQDLRRYPARRRRLGKHDSHPPRDESLDVTLAYLKGKDAESEEAQEQANSRSLAVYA